MKNLNFYKELILSKVASNEVINEKTLLHGFTSWWHYSASGGALINNFSIAATLFSRDRLNAYIHGDNHYSLLKEQADALEAAAAEILSTVNASNGSKTITK